MPPCHLVIKNIKYQYWDVLKRKFIWSQFCANFIRVRKCPHTSPLPRDCKWNRFFLPGVSALKNYRLNWESSCSVWKETRGLDVRSHRGFGFLEEECENSSTRRLEVKASRTMATSTALSDCEDIMSTLCLIWKCIFSSILWLVDNWR